MLAFGAEFVLRSTVGERMVPARDFFHGPFETAVEPNELLTAIRVPAMPSGSGAAYVGFDQPASGFAIVAAFALVAGDDVTVALTGIAGAPLLVRGLSTDAGDEAIAVAVTAALEGQDVNEDVHASADYRRHLATVASTRALRTAARRTS